MRYTVKKLITLIAGSLLIASSSSLFAQSGITLDFNDPDDPRLEQIVTFGNAEIREDGGVGNTGYLSVTDAANGQRGEIAFPDFSDPPGSALESFQITADLRVGAGTASPADGFSFNLIRPDDPLIADIIDPDTGELDPDGAVGQYAGIGSEDSLPEEGSRTGLGIGFDEWQSGARGANSSAESCGEWDANPDAPLDCIGISIRVDGELIRQIPFPTLNGELADQTSLQTGPMGDIEDLGFAQLVIQVTPDLTNEENSNIRISYKDRDVINESIAYKTSPGLLFFGGRTGGANAAHHIDNISIVTDFTRIDLLGDFNEDGTLDMTDFQILTSAMNTGDTVYSDGDIDFSGRVDIADFVVFRREFAKVAAGAAAASTAAVPEPATGILALMAALSLGLVRRRRG